MLDYIKSRLRRRPVKEDAWLHRGRAGDGVGNPQFVSFLQKSGFRKRQLDRHEKLKRFRRAATLTLAWAAGLGCVWIAIESAEALSLF